LVGMLSQELFLHHVYFWLKDPQNPESHALLLDGLRTLGKIPSIRSFHIGVPAGTNRTVIDTSYDFSWLAVFGSPEAQDDYQVDPIHQLFVEQYGHLWERVLIYDSVGAF
jgi:hypothetical protein